MAYKSALSYIIYLVISFVLETSMTGVWASYYFA